MPSPTIQDQAYMKLGRLIHSYQKFERLVKFLVAQSNISGKDGEVEKNLRKRHSASDGQTLGSITNRLFDTMYGPSEELPDSDNINLPYFAFESRVGFNDPADLDQKREQYQAVVADRNTLIHSTLSLDSDEDCEALIEELDRQREQLTPIYKELQDHLKHTIEFAKSIAENPHQFIYEGAPPETIQVGETTYTQD